MVDLLGPRSSAHSQPQLSCVSLGKSHDFPEPWSLLSHEPGSCLVHFHGALPAYAL